MLNAAGAVDEFWAGSSLNKEANIEVAGEVRCCWCNKMYVGRHAERSMKAHHTKKPAKGGCAFQPQSRAGSRAEKAVVRRKKERAQEAAGEVWIGDHKLKNVYNFKYLGFMFLADGDRRHAAAIRMGIARTRFGQLHNIWGSTVIPRSAQMKLFEAGVVSVLVYGSEAWIMDDQLVASLTAWCARCVTHITGESIKDEYKTPTYPLVKKILKRRFRWLGHQLRRDGSLVQQALLHLAQDHISGNYKIGSVISEAPKFTSTEHLLGLAGDRELWNMLSNEICPSSTHVNKERMNNKNVSVESKSYVNETRRELRFMG